MDERTNEQTIALKVTEKVLQGCIVTANLQKVRVVYFLTRLSAILKFLFVHLLLLLLLLLFFYFFIFFSSETGYRERMLQP